MTLAPWKLDAIVCAMVAAEVAALAVVLAVGAVAIVVTGGRVLRW